MSRTLPFSATPRTKFRGKYTCLSDAFTSPDKHTIPLVSENPSKRSAMTKSPTDLTEEELDAISSRCEAATLGPWASYVEGRDHMSGSNFIMTGEGEDRGDDIELSGASIEDQDFIAHARQDVPRLVDEVRRLRRLVERA